MRTLGSGHRTIANNTQILREIGALILMQSELDGNYEAVKADTYPWPAS